MDRELKQCPFCGGAPEVEEEKHDINGVEIRCLRCRAVTAHYGDFHELYENRQEAAVAWNRRAPDPVTAEQRPGGLGFVRTNDLIRALMNSREIIAQTIEDIGPCEHEVNLCTCGERAVLASMDETIAKAKGVG